MLFVPTFWTLLARVPKLLLHVEAGIVREFVLKLSFFKFEHKCISVLIKLFS